MLLRNPPHRVELIAPGGKVERTVAAIVSPLSVEERVAPFIHEQNVTTSIRIDDLGGDPALTVAWRVRVTEPALLAGVYEIRSAMPYSGHTRLLASMSTDV